VSAPFYFIFKQTLNVCNFFQAHRGAKSIRGMFSQKIWYNKNGKYRRRIPWRINLLSLGLMENPCKAKCFLIKTDSAFDFDKDLTHTLQFY